MANANNIFDLYLKYVENSEPPSMFHRWSMLAATGAWLGRNVWLPFGDTRVFPNLYVMLIGDPGTRKSSAVKSVKKLLIASGYSKFASDKTSKEQFLHDLAGNSKEGETDATSGSSMEILFGDAFGEPKEVFIVADEYNEFAGRGNVDFASMLGNFWDWDQPELPFHNPFRTAKDVSIYQPTVSMLGGNTHENFQAAFPPELMGQGFMSRLLLIHSEPSQKKFTIPPPRDEEIKQKLITWLTDIKAEMNGPLQLSTQAYMTLDSIYRSWKPLQDARFKHYSTRRFTHLLKLLVIVTSSRCSMEVSQADVVLANTLLTYAEFRMPEAMGEYGKSRNSGAAVKILDFLQVNANKREPTACKVEDIWAHVRTELDSVVELQKIIAGFLTANKIIWVAKEQGYTIKKRILTTNDPYVDFSLLEETRAILQGR